MEQSILQEIQRSIGRLEGKIDGVNNRLDKVNGSIGNHQGRLNNLETFCDSMKGKIVASALIISGAVAVVGLLLQYYK